MPDLRCAYIDSMNSTADASLCLSSLLHVKPYIKALKSPDTQAVLLVSFKHHMPYSVAGWSKDVHHEVELAIELGPDLTPVRAAVALDLTARDIQSKLKAKQWP
jgi:hypothetical protein